MAGSDEVPEELVQPSRIYGMHTARPNWRITATTLITDQPTDVRYLSHRCLIVREGELIRFDRGRRRKQCVPARIHCRMTSATHSARSLSCRYLYLFNDILLCVDLEAITFWYPWRVDAVASLVGAKVSDCSSG